MRGMRTHRRGQVCRGRHDLGADRSAAAGTISARTAPSPF